MVALLAVIAHATAQDLDEKYATDLLKAGTEAPDMRVGTGKDGKAVRLSDLKGKELDDALAAYGAQLDNSLSSSAMSKLPAAKIVNDTSANSANS